ncbi:AfsR/SARP family transcriptional regulator [Saccharothrix texasensis]|uniref:DNA-binding SARP family transcriptional activator n=1 Tax=Saccharothrix texasensis TaxID=103734 RepID=A0A3N1GX56_9PSEU|nr:BTAD domain-containing putative transcriptional regulator [Saccharothrix texasensis]ROP34818.1 DNA-binding SARP family transcriptional activator [Saccharothrix texasensis]
MLCLLGEVAVHVDGRPVELGHAKQRCLLAVLAVEVDRVVPVDRLIEQVWGVDLPLRTRSTLHGYISRLRRALAQVEGVAIERRSGGYTLTADPTRPLVDLRRFRELCALAREQTDDAQAARLLTEALGLWRGQALTGVHGKWAEVERERLDRERLAAQHELTDIRLRRGEGSALVVELTTRAAEHPLDERVAGQYLSALHQAGRTADALEHYREVRERLVEELGTDPGAALRDLHRRILAADPALAAAQVEAGAVRSPVVPLQLPAAPARFTGRLTQLADLDRVLTTAPDDPSVQDSSPRPSVTVAISTLSGAGGVGKTWLALTWAHRNLHRFPDGQLFADLRGFSLGDPRQAADVLADFLAALGVDRDHHPRDLDARAALYRTHTTGKHLLILLDNAVDSNQVTPLLPGGTTCTVLVTSRHRLPALLTRHGAHPVHVDVLTDSEARALLVTALGDSRVKTEAERAVSELIALCGRLPLALSLIATRIRSDPGLLEDVVTDLGEHGLGALDSDDPDASLPTVLSWSLRRLTEQQRVALALLGIAPGPDTDLPAVTSLIGLPRRDTHAVLRGLVDSSLITHAPGGRYSMHDLIRDHVATTAHHTLSEPVRQAALERVVDFYLHTAHTADRLLNPHRAPVRLDPPASGSRPHPLPNPSAALSWLDTHHRHLPAVQHTAATHGLHWAVWHLAWTLTTFHLRRGHRHDELAVWQTAAEVTDHLPDPATRIRAHRHLGRAHTALGQHEEGLTNLHRALELAGHHDDPVQSAYTHQALAWAWGLREDHRRASGHAQHALDLYRRLDQPGRAATALNLMGWYAAQLGDHATARDRCQAALDVHRQHHNAHGEASALTSLGYIDHCTGRHDQAVQHYRHALTLRRSLGHTTGTADTLDHLGHPYSALGRHTRARAVWQEALGLYRQQGRDDDAARVQRQLDDLGGATTNRKKNSTGRRPGGSAAAGTGGAGLA